MREALGGSLLLNIVVIFVSLIMLFFVSILSYSKAYRAKNRIIDVIEKYENYNTLASSEIISSLNEMGYQIGNCQTPSVRVNIKNNTDRGTEIVTSVQNKNSEGYKYCVYEICMENLERGICEGKKYYKVTTYVQFYFPIIGDLLAPPVHGETKILGNDYNY